MLLTSTNPNILRVILIPIEYFIRKSVQIITFSMSRCNKDRSQVLFDGDVSMLLGVNILKGIEKLKVILELLEGAVTLTILCEDNQTKWDRFVELNCWTGQHLLLTVLHVSTLLVWCNSWWSLCGSQTRTATPSNQALSKHSRWRHTVISFSNRSYTLIYSKTRLCNRIKCLYKALKWTLFEYISLLSSPSLNVESSSLMLTVILQPFSLLGYYRL